MKSLFHKYSAIIERRDHKFFKDISDQALVYKELDQMNTEILNNFKQERENIRMIRERKEYVKAKLSDVEYLANKVNQVHPEIRQSIGKSLHALHLTMALHS